MKKRIYTVVMLAMMGASVAQADSIVAVVDDVPISRFDVGARVRLLLLQKGQEGQEATNALKKEALDVLIEEQIKRGVVEKQGIGVSEEDVARAIQHLEQQNGMTPGSFDDVLKRNNVPMAAFENQVRTDLGWLQAVQRAGIDRSVTAEEIKSRRQVIRKELAQESLHLAEIILPDEETALAVWSELEKGASFRKLAEEKSIADSRMMGGEVKGVTNSYYGKKVAPILEQMSPGQLSRPIKVSQGYALVLMIGRREAITTDTVPVWDLMQAMVPLNKGIERVLTPDFTGGCNAFSGVMSEKDLSETVQRGQVSPSQLPVDVKAILSEVDVGRLVGPIRTPNGALYFMKCDEKQVSVMPDDASIREQIEAERMEHMSQRLLSEARRDVVIEYK